MMYIGLIKELKAQEKEAVGLAKSERGRADRYKRECEELKIALSRAEAAIADGRQRQSRQSPIGMGRGSAGRMLSPDRHSADGRMPQAAEFPRPLSIVGRNGSYTLGGSVTSPPVSRNGHEFKFEYLLVQI